MFESQAHPAVLFPFRVKFHIKFVILMRAKGPIFRQIEIRHAQKFGIAKTVYLNFETETVLCKYFNDRTRYMKNNCKGQNSNKKIEYN